MSLKSVIFSCLPALSYLAVIADPVPPDESVHEEAVSGIVMDMSSKKPLKDVNITAVDRYWSFHLPYQCAGA